MAVRTHRDPFRRTLIGAQSLVWAYLVAQGAKWITTATVILLTEIIVRVEPLLALIR